MKLFRNYFKKPVAITPIQSAATQEQEGNEEEYTFDVVGESFQRDHLVQLIKKHNLTDAGELYTTATLKLEPENAFDPTAVMVVIERIAKNIFASVHGSELPSVKPEQKLMFA